MAGLEDWLGLHWIISAPLALFIAYIPVVGSIIGMFGAVTAWHWSWLHAAALFFGPFAAILFFAILSGEFETRR
jgi:cobalamin synthase